MKDVIEAKRQQAETEIESWQGQLVQAQEQLQRWIGILSFCDELLSVEATAENEDD